MHSFFLNMIVYISMISSTIIYQMMVPHDEINKIYYFTTWISNLFIEQSSLWIISWTLFAHI